MRVFTLATPADAARAVVLARSLRRHHPDWPVTIGVVSGRVSIAGALPTGIDFVTLAELGVEPDAYMTAALEPRQLVEHARGAALGALLDGDEAVLYLNPSLRVTGPLDALATIADSGGVAVVPYRVAAGAATDRVVDLLATGAIHPGVLAIGRGAHADALLAAWPGPELAARPGPAAGERGVFEAWCDALPTQFKPITTLDSPPFVAGWWNVEHDTIPADFTAHEATTASPSLVDFTTFDPTRPHLFSVDHDCVALSTAPGLAQLCALHTVELLEAEREVTGGAYPYDTLRDGTPLTRRLRQIVAGGFADGELTESVFSERGMRELYAWLNTPAIRGDAAGLTRYHEAIWRANGELQTAYPQLDGPDGRGYAGWLWIYAPPDLPLPAALLPPKPAELAAGEPTRPESLDWGVNVAGFLSAELGLGEAARLLVGALDEAGVPVLPIQSTLMPPCRHDVDFPHADPAHAPFAINIVCMNGDTIPTFARDVGDGFFDRRYTIALWWWELEAFPVGWERAFDHLDEIWVASETVYRAIAPVSPVPVVKIPMPVRVPEVVTKTRAQLGVPEDTFNFLFVYDYHSTAARKNPVGAVRAFRRAFAPGSGASLVLKCINAENLPADHEAVLVAAQGHPDIHVLDGYVSAADKDALVAACDCYVSLHRAEGFGLTLAEAMVLGKPLIASRCGGALEFVTDGNALLVDCGTARVGDGAHPYPANATWAEPDLAHAASLMREVFDNPDAACERARRGQDDLRRRHRPEVAGRAMERRLRVVFERLGSQPKYAVSAGFHRPRWARPTTGRRFNPRRAVRLAMHHVERLMLGRRAAVGAAVDEAERRLLALHADTLADFRRLRRTHEDAGDRASDVRPQAVVDPELTPAAPTGNGLSRIRLP